MTDGPKFGRLTGVRELYCSINAISFNLGAVDPGEGPVVAASAASNAAAAHLKPDAGQCGIGSASALLLPFDNSQRLARLKRTARP